MYTPRVLDFGSPRKRRKTNTGDYVVVTPSPGPIVELKRKTPMSKYTVVRKLAGRAWTSKYGRSLRSRARAKGSRYLKRAGRRGLSRLRSRRGLKSNSLMSKVGMSPNSENCKHFAIRQDNTDVLLAPYVLTSRNLTAVEKQTAAAEPDRREGPQIDVKGIKVNMIFENVGIVEPCVVNMAVVIPKVGWHSEASVPPEGFFRGTDANRALDIGQANSGLINNTRAINNDTYWVLWRKRIRVAGKGGDTQLQGKNIRNYRKYIPVHRQFRFTNDGVTSGQDPYLVIWYDYMNRDAAVNRNSTDLHCKQEIYCVYKDIM